MAKHLELLAATLIAAASLSQAQTIEGHRIEAPPENVNYSAIKPLFPVICKVLDLEEHTERQPQPANGKEKLHGALLLKISVEETFGAALPSTIVAEMGIAPHGPYQSAPHVGDRVVVTLTKERAETWSCGRLRPCSEKPTEVWEAMEIFQELRWP
jgi:hypothetical protein